MKKIIILILCFSAFGQKKINNSFDMKAGFGTLQNIKSYMDTIKKYQNENIDSVKTYYALKSEIGGGGTVDLDTITTDTIKVNYGLQATRIKVDYLNYINGKSTNDTIQNAKIAIASIDSIDAIGVKTSRISNTGTITTDSVTTKRIKVINNGNPKKELAVFDYNNTNNLGGIIAIKTENGYGAILFNCYSDTATGYLKATRSGRPAVINYNYSTGLLTFELYNSTTANTSLGTSDRFKFFTGGDFETNAIQVYKNQIFDDETNNKNQIIFRNYDWDIYEYITKNTISHYNNDATNGHQKNCLVLHSYFGNINLGDSTFTGNVGIGKDTAIYKLDVNGNIRANNINVTNDTSTTIKTGKITSDSIKIGDTWYSNRSGTIPCTLKTTDFTTQQITTIKYIVVGRTITLAMDAKTGTSNSSTLRVYGDFASLFATPVSENIPVPSVTSNGTVYAGYLVVNNTYLQFYRIGSTFYSSGTKAFASFRITFQI